MPDDLKAALGDFARFARTLNGDEKSEAVTRRAADLMARVFRRDRPAR